MAPANAVIGQDEGKAGSLNQKTPVKTYTTTALTIDTSDKGLSHQLLASLKAKV
jgi:hypothetical protein